MEHRGNCSYVQKGATCDCGLWDQSATLFKAEARIRELEAALRPFVDDCIRAEHIEAARKVLEGEHSPSIQEGKS
jgi:hypothetical protein